MDHHLYVAKISIVNVSIVRHAVWSVFICPFFFESCPCSCSMCSSENNLHRRRYWCFINITLLRLKFEIIHCFFWNKNALLQQHYADLRLKRSNQSRCCPSPTDQPNSHGWPWNLVSFICSLWAQGCTYVITA
jgi:hypothetical protein